jgi:hypothetical protein
MDFRSNEAGRTALEISRFLRGQNPFPRLRHLLWQELRRQK